MKNDKNEIPGGCTISGLEVRKEKDLYKTPLIYRIEIYSGDNLVDFYCDYSATNAIAIIKHSGRRLE